MKHLGLFEGIGGFSLAARWMGWETLAWCEWNPFGQQVLRHHFPEAEGFGDITKTDFTPYANRIDILTGGFPCQPYSTAGKRLGKEDDRHLWPEMLRAIREVKPRWVVGENVYGLVNWNEGLVFNEVQADLEAQGYEVQPYLIPAAGVNAPHKRDRVWFVAYRTDQEQREPAIGRLRAELGNGFGLTADSENNRQQRQPRRGAAGAERRLLPEGLGEGSQLERSCKTTANAHSINGRPGTGGHNRPEADYDCSDFRKFPTQSPVLSGNDGLSSRLDGITFSKWRNESIKAAGNAIVPQVAYEIYKAIAAFEELNHQKALKAA